MKVKIVLSIAVLAFGLLAPLAQGQPEVNVVITYTSTTRSNVVATANAGELIYTDRPTGGQTNGYRFLPDSVQTDPAFALATTAPLLVGAKFIRTANDDKNETAARHLEFTIDRPSTIYLAYDKRGTDIADFLQDGTWTLEAAMTVRWTQPGGGEDGSSPMPVYSKHFDAGTVTLPGNKHGTTAGVNTNYIPFIVPDDDPTYNPPPVVDAGPNQVIYITAAAQLAGTVTDEPPQQGDPGVLSWYWYKVSGPGTATFNPADTTDIPNPTVTFSAKGVYELMLQATDGSKDANDVVTITVKDRNDEFLVGYWNFEDNVLDQSGVNHNDGTIVAGNGGGTYDPDAAVGSKSINLINVNPADPNLNYVDLGAAPEHDFGTTDWTVCGWVNTTQQFVTADQGKGTIFGNGGDTGGGHRYCLIVNEGGASSNGLVRLIVDDDVTKVEVQSTTIVNNGLWHFVLGQRAGGEIRLYVDGVLQGRNVLPAGYDLSGTSQYNSYIGVITDHDQVAPTLYKHLDGLVDDVRVYNYALPLTDEPQYDSILSLTAMGPLVATIDAGADIEYNWKPGIKTALAATITDLGAPNPMTIMWSTESGPGQAVFDDPMSPATLVGFPAGGVYVLKLTVWDEGIELTDTLQVTVNAPTCADVIGDGLAFLTDLDKDCYVGLSDLALMLSNWAQCNDPKDTDCTWPF